MRSLRRNLSLLLYGKIFESFPELHWSSRGQLCSSTILSTVANENGISLLLIYLWVVDNNLLWTIITNTWGWSHLKGPIHRGRTFWMWTCFIFLFLFSNSASGCRESHIEGSLTVAFACKSYCQDLKDRTFDSNLKLYIHNFYLCIVSVTLDSRIQISSSSILTLSRTGSDPNKVFTIDLTW